MSRGGRRVVVIGGGLAGLSAALCCVDGGAEVTLLERRPRLGGATWSFERNGLAFDNGQHVYLRCCSAYRRFLDRIGSTNDAPLQDRLDIPVLAPGDDGPSQASIRRNGLPPPLHLATSLLAYRHLGLLDRLRLGRAVRALMRLELTDPRLDDETFGHFLARYGQSRSAIEGLWDLITVPTTNLSASEVSLALAAKVFKTGLLEAPDSADLGWATVPLGRLHGERALAQLERSGATVRRRAPVEVLEVGEATSDQPEGRSISSVVVGGERITGDAFVLAVPNDAAADLLPEGRGPEPAGLRALGSVPILDVHVVYDRKVMDFRLAAGVRSPVQFVFDRTDAAGLDPREGQCLAVSVSNASAEVGERPEVLIDRYTRALGDLFPAARTARVLDAVVSREHAATFRGVPGTARLRPGSLMGYGNLFLAGSWTATGWPATMEGAVRSGVVAAGHALGAIGSHRGAPRQSEEVPA